MEDKEREVLEFLLTQYEVREDGSVYSKRIGRLMKPGLNRYNHICFSVNGISRTYRVHRLVALLHVPNPENKPCVNHKNANTHDNRASNLEWCTLSENTRHSFEVMGRKIVHSEETKRRIGNRHSRKIHQYTLDGEYVQSFDSHTKAAKYLGSSISGFSEFRKGNLKTFKGYKWKFDEK